MYKFLLIHLLICLPSTTFASFQDLVTLLWDKFWSVSCTFSSLVSRSKRSLDLPHDMDNVDDIFDFLYPNADVQVKDYFEKSSSRSWNVFQSNSFSTWIDNLFDFWKSECRRLATILETTHRGHSSNETNEEVKMKEESVMMDKNLTAHKKTGQTRKVHQSPLASKTADEFFTTYGNDIEYFFPLIGFGIPFDGEITLLGFHGFKGVFNYK